MNNSVAFFDVLGKGDAFRHRLTVMIANDITNERIDSLERKTKWFFDQMRAKVVIESATKKTASTRGD